MKKTVKFEGESWICDCTKCWPEDVDTCVCGKGPPDYKEMGDRRFPYMEFVFEFPGKYEVCGCCRGTGTTAFGYDDREQIAWTESEWAGEEPEFKSDYIQGKYDKPCPVCNGERVTLVIDEDKLSDVQQKQYDAWTWHLERGYEDDSIAEAERRFGC